MSTFGVYKKFTEGKASYKQLLEWVIKTFGDSKETIEAIECLRDSKPKKRTGPMISAACLLIGFQLPVYKPYFSVWEVKSRGGHRAWVKLPGPDKLVIGKGQPTSFVLPADFKFKKMGEMMVTGKVAVGENMYKPFALPLGKYNIYNDLDVLIISKKPMKKAVWKYAKYDVGVDGGMFGFADMKSIGATKTKMELFGIDFPDEYNEKIWNKLMKNGGNYVSLTRKDMGLSGNGKDVVGILAGTGGGDGSFPVYTTQGAIMIVGYEFLDQLMRYKWDFPEKE